MPEQIILFEFTPDHEGHALCFIRSTPPVFHGTTVAPVNPRDAHWDYWVDGKVDLAYRLYLSKDDAVCRALLQALNHPRPDGNKQLWAFGPVRSWYALSLYRDPLFLPWKLHQLSEPIGVFPNVDWLRYSIEWMAAPLYNDGKDVAVVRTDVGVQSEHGNAAASPGLRRSRVLRAHALGQGHANVRGQEGRRTARLHRFRSGAFTRRTRRGTERRQTLGT